MVKCMHPQMVHPKLEIMEMEAVIKQTKSDENADEHLEMMGTCGASGHSFYPWTALQILHQLQCQSSGGNMDSLITLSHGPNLINILGAYLGA